jgi:hypothetical protein
MTGKIFKESSNVIQDQAKILFSYYQKMAEKIVSEEEKYEKEIASCKDRVSQLNQEFLTPKKMRLISIIAAVLIIPIGFIVSIYLLGLIIIPIIFAITSHLKMNKIQAEIVENEKKITEFQKLHDEIFRDYKVSKLGVAYIPVAEQIKYENKSFIVDYTGVLNETEIKLQLSKQNDLLISTIGELEKLSETAPIIEGSDEIESMDTEQYSLSMQQLNQHDYFGKLEKSLRTISYCMDDLDVTSVSLPLVANESMYLEFLKEYATNDVPSNSPIIEVFDSERFQEDISKFQQLNKLKDSLSRHTAKFEDVLKELMMTMANSVQAISAMKMSSTDKMVLESNKILYKILKSPYTHYSNKLEEAEIERIRLETFNYGESVQDYVPFQLKDSSKMRYDLQTNSWVAEDGSGDNLPFSVHQIQEEIVAPIVQNLMNETRIERLKIYNHIKDQKISYLNKWHQDTEDFYGRNRAESADLVNLMRASLRDYIAAANTLSSLKKTEESMSNSGGSLDATVVSKVNNNQESLIAFEEQSKQFQDVQLDFENFMEKLKEEIDYKAEKFEHIDYYDALLRDGNSKDIAVATNEIYDLDDRRKALINVNPLFAKTSEIPPVPSIESLTNEHFMLNLPELAKISLNELENESLNIIPESKSENSELEKKDEYDNVLVNDSLITDVESEDTIYSENSISEIDSDVTAFSDTESDSSAIESIIDEDVLTNSFDSEDNENDNEEDDDLFDDEDEPILDGPSDNALNISSLDESEQDSSEINKNQNSFSSEEKDIIVDQSVNQGKDVVKEQISNSVPIPSEITDKTIDFITDKGIGFLKKNKSDENNSDSSENNEQNENKSSGKVEDLKSKFSGLMDKKSDIKKRFGF